VKVGDAEVADVHAEKSYRKDANDAMVSALI